MKNWGGQFTPKLGGHFELESGAHFKLELGGQYHWNLQYLAKLMIEMVLKQNIQKEKVAIFLMFFL